MQTEERTLSHVVAQFERTRAEYLLHEIIALSSLARSSKDKQPR